MTSPRRALRDGGCGIASAALHRMCLVAGAGSIEPCIAGYADVAVLRLYEVAESEFTRSSFAVGASSWSSVSELAGWMRT